MVATRSDVEAFAQMVLAAKSDGTNRGVSDAAFGRVYGHNRFSYDTHEDYDLGYRFGRFVLFDNIPAWRAAMVTHQDAAEYIERFNNGTIQER